MSAYSFDPVLYRREVMVGKMKPHKRQGKLEKFRTIRPTKDGIFYQVWNGKEWVKKFLTDSQIEEVLGELS